MDEIFSKKNKPFLLALLIVLCMYVGFELFKFGFYLGKEKTEKDTTIKSGTSTK